MMKNSAFRSKPYLAYGPRSSEEATQQKMWKTLYCRGFSSRVIIVLLSEGGER